MRKTFRYRLFPTSAQRTALQKALHACRWVYNQALETRQAAWEQRQESISRYDTINRIPGWRAEHPFLNDAFSQCLQASCIRLDLAFRVGFGRVGAGEQPGYPRFNSLGRYDSFTYPQSGFQWVDSGRGTGKARLGLSTIGGVKIKVHRPLEGVCKTLTTGRDRVGNGYASFSGLARPKPLPPTDQGVGIDRGVTTFATLSNGSEILRQRRMKQDAQDMARLQRKQEKLPTGSPARRQVVGSLGHAYPRQTNRRHDFVHPASRKRVNAYPFLASPDLHIQEIQANRNQRVNQGIADVAWGSFVHLSQRKAEAAGRLVILVNPKGTTQNCAPCGKMVPKDLSIRKHACPACGLKCSRDPHAAFNILARGLASIGPDP